MPIASDINQPVATSFHGSLLKALECGTSGETATSEKRCWCSSCDCFFPPVIVFFPPVIVFSSSYYATLLFPVISCFLQWIFFSWKPDKMLLLLGIVFIFIKGGGPSPILVHIPYALVRWFFYMCSILPNAFVLFLFLCALFMNWRLVVLALVAQNNLPETLCSSLLFISNSSLYLPTFYTNSSSMVVVMILTHYLQAGWLPSWQSLALFSESTSIWLVLELWTK